MSGQGDTAHVRRLASKDRFFGGLGVEVVQAEPAQIILRLRITEAHVNFNGYCHGGVIFSLADSAMGFASNADGQQAVAIDAHLTYSTAARAGDVLTATATELTRTRRTGTYRIEVRNGEGALVSQFTGTVYRPNKPARDEIS